MSLKNLHEKLYNKKPKEKRKLETEYSNYEKGQDLSPEEKTSSKLDEERERLLKQEAFFGEEETTPQNPFFKSAIFLGGAGFLILLTLIVLGIVFYSKYKEGLFDPAKVVIEISGNQEIDSGKQYAYKFKIINNNKVDLEKSRLKVKSPSEFLFKESEVAKEELGNINIEIGKIDSKSSKEFELSFDVFGAKDSQIYLKGILEYQPEGFGSLFDSQNQISLLIKSSALNLSVVTSQEASSGELVEAKIYIENKSENPFENLVLVMDYPEGFLYQTANPEPTKGERTWEVGTLGPSEQREIVVKGNLKGPIESIKSISAGIGTGRVTDNFIAYNKAESTIKIIKPRIEITQSINGKTDLKDVKAGDFLNFLIKFKNNSEEPLRDLILTNKINSYVVDENSFIIKQGGHYDDETKLFTWMASDVPKLKNLNIQEEGQVEFGFKVKDVLPAEKEDDENFKINISPAIESLDINSPLGENKKVFSGAISLKVQTKLILEVLGNYKDKDIPNNGPVPIEQGEETTFTLKFNLLNTSNDLKDLVVKTSFPSGVGWKDKYSPAGPNISFNERTNELSWDIGSIEAGAGFRSPMKNLVFQIGLKPSQYQVNQGENNIKLVNSIKATAFDTFLERGVEYEFKEFKLSGVNDY